MILKDGKVSCECCCGCENPPLKKYKVTSANFGAITFQNPMSCTGDDIYGWFFEQYNIINGIDVTLSWRSCDGSDPQWFVFAIGGEPIECFNLIAIIDGEDPTGTHQIFGCASGEDPNPCDNCDDWTVTIAEDLDE